MRRHNRLLLHLQRILLPPQTRHSLPLRIEIQPGFPIEITRPPTRHTLLVAREAEHGQGDRDGHVDA
jgi:hypothetical protein